MTIPAKKVPLKKWEDINDPIELKRLAKENMDGFFSQLTGISEPEFSVPSIDTK